MSCNLSAVSEYCIGRDMRVKEWFVQQQAPLVPGREKKSFAGLMNWWLKEGHVSDKDWKPQLVPRVPALPLKLTQLVREEEGKKKEVVDDDFEDGDLEYPQDIESGDPVGLGFDDKFKPNAKGSSLAAAQQRRVAKPRDS
ncbi:hypothetical protein HDU90_006007 [Geranomyces variabilis]|nr:hypothetical protein HDU90_006007 [Geranomyces variabilis]